LQFFCTDADMCVEAAVSFFWSISVASFWSFAIVAASGVAASVVAASVVAGTVTSVSSQRLSRYQRRSRSQGTRGRRASQAEG
jgi:hypothetical protein